MMEVDTDYEVNESSSSLFSGFTKAYSNNLPCVSSEMLWNYVVQLMQVASQNPEQAKMLQTVAASKPEYSDDSICYAQLKRDERHCIVKAQIITGNSTVEAKIFQLTAIVDEHDERIHSVECSECFESGDCRHAISFLAWIHRKSEADDSSEVVCYFRGPIFAELESLPPKPALNKTKAKNFIREIVRILQTEDIDCPLRWNFSSANKKFGNLSIHEMIMTAVKNKFDTAQFFEHAYSVISASQSLLVDKTKFTPKYNSWYLELRYARITSAKVSDCINLNVTQAVLYETILGCHKEIDQNTQRKKMAVRQRLEKYTKTKYENCKIILNPNYPIIFDVPDGICQSHVIEIKCPKSQDHMQKYVTENGSICEKYYMEIQIHMYMHGKTAGVVCVADPDFETNNEIYMHSFNLNRNFAINKLNKAMDYWKNIVYPELMNSWSE
ncbi:uncharacterized protein LOC129771127 isoform X2 [Toxorhynchites rutilus septentrionalis]|uniref:uncharacterized protein LOC129771127 isoform X2 n=1 Tax=Toxorhynchites rutilus septentrionalis TaxID=329112 RepID=UPI0024784612|nr:uncharacterized protein LOC129771127 isoform X2 [Toxorhynchites rutilus septentrionalis]